MVSSHLFNLIATLLFSEALLSEIYWLHAVQGHKVFTGALSDIGDQSNRVSSALNKYQKPH